jgi:Holliday junction resolvase RusA-like endonuclease
MKNYKKVILNITPMTHVRATQGDSIFFRIPRDKLRPAGLKRLIRLEKYNQYKVDLLAEAKRKNFTMPPQGASIIFFIPVPSSWSKKKKKQYHGKFHQSKPDLDNLLKSFGDSLISEDKYIAHYGELSKRWVDFDSGWIEITILDPTEVLINPPSKGISQLL